SNGTLDNSFDGNGIIWTDFYDGNDDAYAMIQQPDGKIVLAGTSLEDDTWNYDFALARYSSEGVLDSSFGTDGKVITDLGNGGEVVYSLALQQDGKILAAGGSSGNFALLRYNTNGILDSTFGNGGQQLTDLGGTDCANSIAIQPDGKI